jgi:HEAT repeat protein
LDPISGLFLLAAGAAVGFGVLRRGRRMGPGLNPAGHARRLAIWRGAATACGLTNVRNISFWSPQLEAKADPFNVRFEVRNADSLIVVAIPEPPGFGGVRIYRHQADGPAARGIEIGDEEFDRTFFIQGSMRLVYGVLDAEARRILLRVNAKCYLEIAGGEIRAEMFDSEVPFILPLLLELGRRFVQKTDIARCLFENARRDPAAGVRINQLLLLVREHARDPRTAAVLRAACSDPSPRVRLWAAQTLGDEGRGVLRELTESTEDDNCSAQALGLVGRELPFERKTTILGRALDGRRLRTARACVEVLGLSGDAAAAEPLAKVLTREKGELAAAAAVSLGKLASPAAEPPLIQALEHEIPEVQAAAAAALGHVGSAAAVLPLKEMAESSRFGRDLRQTARQAIAEIQSRLPGATPGQLSLAGAETGQLSLAADQAGQLSLPSEEAGQLSLSGEEGREAPEGE